MKPIKISACDVSLQYGAKQALKDININIYEKSVTAFIGPSGCGKSSFLRSMNRMNDAIPNMKFSGKILINGEDIYAPHIDPAALRTRVGMVFQKPNPFPKTIYDNIAYGPRIHKMTQNKTELDRLVQDCLERAALWSEVKNNLNQLAGSLSGGQQQRLCIARAIAVNPEILLMDEPCSALDPIATAKIETLITNLKENYTIIIVTHSMQQARRISDYTAFFHMGDLTEYNDTETLFSVPKEKKTQDYLSGRFG